MKKYHVKVYLDDRKILSKQEPIIEEKKEANGYKIIFHKKKVIIK